MKVFIVTILLFMGSNFNVYSQRPHLEVGASFGYLNGKHQLTSTEQLNIQYGKANLFARVSKQRLGTELNLGFGMGYNYKIDQNDKLISGNPHIAIATIDLLPLFYIIKSSKWKWDFQTGISNQFFLTSRIDSFNGSVKTWQPSWRIGTNITYKYYLIGVYTAPILRSSFTAKDAQQFGGRVGLIF